MTVIQNNIEVARSAEEVYNFLADCNNHEQLMPSNIYNWSSTADEARFTIQNMAKLALRVAERVPHSQIRVEAVDSPPFAVSLRWEVEPVSEQSARARLVIEADLNMMMKMLASGPLQKLVDHQLERLKEVLS